MSSVTNDIASNAHKCTVCSKSGDNGIALMQCSRCKAQWYCGRDCQKSDWPTHKTICKKPWYDKYRKCRDGRKHEGMLELITWQCDDDGAGYAMGWGNTLLEEADSLKEKFEVEFGGDYEKLYDYWPQAYRWTCCGTDAGIQYGCDHHGSGSTPCTCDFCRMGKPLPDRIYNKKSMSRMGLKLKRGPDPRSYNLGHAAIAETMRAFLGSDEH